MFKRLKMMWTDDSTGGRGIKNAAVMLFRNALFGSAFIFGSNALLQTFLSQRGVDDMRIGLLGSAGSIAQVAVTFLLMGVCDRIVRPVRFSVIGIVLQTVLPAAVIAAALVPGIGGDALFAAVFAATVAQALVAGARNLVESKMFAHLVPMSWLGRLTGADGVLTGVLATASSAITVFLTHRADPRYSIPVLFGISAALILGSGVIGRGLNLIDYVPDAEGSGSPLKALVKILKMPRFNRLVVPNLLRGAMIAISLMIMPVGIHRLGMTLQHAAYIVTAGTVANIAGAACFTLLIRRLRSEYMTLYGTLIGSAGLFVMALCGSIPAFVSGAFLLLFGKEWVDRGVPLGVYETVPAPVMGAYSAGRLVLMFIATAAAQFAVGALIGRVDMLVMLAGIAALQTAAGVMFMASFRKFKNEDKKADR